MNLKIAKKIAPVTRFINKGALKVKAHSPEILIAGGIILGAVAIVSAIKATPKAEDILEDRRELIDNTKEAFEANYISENEYKARMISIFKKNVAGISRVYLPTVLFFASSATCIIGANSIYKKRYAALSAAFVAVDTSFREYRKRVAEEFGDKKEQELFNGKKSEDVVIFSHDEEGNKTCAVETETNYSNAGYAKWFGKYAAPTGTTEPGNIMYKNNGILNIAFLKNAQETANTLLQIRGYMFLNDVYDILKIPHTKAGQIVGWIWDAEKKDTFIDIGIFNEENPDREDFEKGLTDGIMLRFNPQGDIYSLMAEEV